MHLEIRTVLVVLLLATYTLHAEQLSTAQVPTTKGVIEGLVSADGKVRIFKGVPYAQPPVGPLRWKAPLPASSWTGVRKAVDFAPRCMQGRIYDDMVFRDPGLSEDCLYLNLWVPADSSQTKLPVMVWIHGGGFTAGSSSEPRQDGTNLAKKGVIVVSMNYRLGIFGFFAHSELTKESGHRASGNYGLLDQVAALEWVKKNIGAFGGDPDNVTVFGESAGSFSVSALMASPLAQGLFQRAMGESGAFFSTTLATKPRAEAETSGEKFAQSVLRVATLPSLRAKPAQDLLDAALKQPDESFLPNIDGYFLPADCLSIYAAGKQSHVPLLAGWNKDEEGFQFFFANTPPTLANYAARAKARFGRDSEEFLKVYSATNDAEAKRAAQDYAGDEFIAYSTWKWMDLQLKTGASPVYRYQFDQTLPLPESAPPDAEPTAPHSAEIEFVFGALSSKNLPWRPEDDRVSELMRDYWTNFAKTGDPNGPGLPRWPEYTAKDGHRVLHLAGTSFAAPDNHSDRYEFLDNLNPAKAR